MLSVTGRLWNVSEGRNAIVTTCQTSDSTWRVNAVGRDEAPTRNEPPPTVRDAPSGNRSTLMPSSRKCR